MQKLQVRFFRSESGREPVREWLKELGKPDSTYIGEDIRTVQYGWPVGMPVCRSLGNGLWETRTNLDNNRIARVIFYIDDGVMYLLHGFIKKTKETPPRELEIASLRKNRLRGEKDD